MIKVKVQNQVLEKVITNKTSSTKKHSKVKTGDDMIVVPYALLAMAAAGGYIALQRKNKEN